MDSFAVNRMAAHTRTFLIALAVTCIMRCLHAQETATKVGRPTQTQINTWIAELANRDPKPFAEPYLLEPPRKANRESLRIVKKRLRQTLRKCTGCIASFGWFT